MHSHALPQGVTWRNLIALGVSGGLLPCPSALIVMLGAIALHRVGFGMVLILAFSVGLAAVLTGIGLLFVYAGRLMGRFAPRGRLAMLLPIASALGVFLLGLVMTTQAALQV
jgi:nickel/cobalt exporter